MAKPEVLLTQMESPLAQREVRPGYTHTKLGWIPEEWEIEHLGNIIEIRNGQVDPKNPVYNAMTLVAPNHIESGSGRLIEKVSAQKQDAISGKYYVECGQVIYSKIRPYLRKAVMADENCLCSADAYPISGNEQLDNGFLLLTMLSERFTYYATSASGRTGIPKVNREDLSDFMVALPRISEQRRIAALLGAWDRAIATTQQLVVAQQQRKQGLMHELLTGKRRFPGFEPKGGTRYVKSKIGLVPSDWKELPLRKLFAERNEIGYNDLALLSVTSTGVVLQSETERKDNSKEDKSAYKRICPGDIGYNTMRMWQGRSAVSHIEGIISPAYTVLTPTNLMDTGYGGHLFQLSPMIHLFYRYSQGMASDTWNLKYKHFGPIVVPIPTIAEQRAIARLLGAIDRYITELETNLDHLTTQKRGLMQQLLTGQIRVKA